MRSLLAIACVGPAAAYAETPVVLDHGSCFLDVRRFAPEVPELEHVRPRVDHFPTAPRVVPARPPIAEPGLARETVNRVVQRSASSLRACYQRALELDPELAGSLSVQFEIAVDGTVVHARVARDSLQDPAIVSCVLARIVRLKFPAAARTTIVTYPFLFTH